MRLLLVEDELELAEAIAEVLRKSSAVVDHVATLADASAALDIVSYDVVILDRQLPDGDGISLIPGLRAKKIQTPVLVLTAKDTLPDRVDGLDQGADDYLAKPFAVEELKARLRALHRRSPTAPKELIQVANLEFDFVNKQVAVRGELIRLPRRELLLLDAMLRRYGRTVLRTTIEDALYSLDDNIESNALDVHISRLRRKLSELDSGVQILTVRGVGYLMKAAS